MRLLNFGFAQKKGDVDNAGSTTKSNADTPAGDEIQTKKH